MTDPKPAADTSFRDHAANERTLLAWIRTGIALMGFGFAIARFGLFLRQLVEAQHIEAAQTRGLGSAAFGVTLVALGLVTNAAATIRYARSRQALIERREAPASPALVYLLGAGSVIVAGAMAVMLAKTMAE